MSRYANQGPTNVGIAESVLDTTQPVNPVTPPSPIVIAARDRYRKLLFDLLPTGKAWIRDVGTTLYKLLEGIAYEFGRVDERAKFLVQDVNPYYTTELLEDWERVLNLPDDCSADSLTISQRQNQVVEKLTRTGGQSKAFLIQALAKLGYTITITEYQHPFQAGISVAGDSLTNEEWQKHFTVHSTGGDSSQAFVAGRSVAGDPLGLFGSELLECTIYKLKPADTTVDFDYL